MKTRNSVQLIGYLGSDPVLKACKNGDQMTRLRLATHHPVKNGNDANETKWKATWHTVIVWGTEFATEIACTCLKGSHLMVEGDIRYREYKDNRGHTRYVTEIKARRIYNLDR